ncbi:MAG: dockerin type I domain-containing protein [Sedimentisphaerales bacterium]
MKKKTILLLFFCMTAPALGAVSTKVYLADGNTPFDGQDIMVGTKLTIIISSDANTIDPYPVDLVIEGADRNYGYLPEAYALEAAGIEPLIYPWEDDLHQGFSFQTDVNAVAGDWFIADYIATAVGNCMVAFYDNFEFAYYIPFSHVRTRDFNGDTKVDFADFAMLASYWQEANCGDVNDCEGTDLDINGRVDVNDLMLFCDFWLEKTE